jgi:hypothetical protein
MEKKPWQFDDDEQAEPVAVEAYPKATAAEQAAAEREQRGKDGGK